VVPAMELSAGGGGGGGGAMSQSSLGNIGLHSSGVYNAYRYDTLIPYQCTVVPYRIGVYVYMCTVNYD
jgi:hypothetical protein